ncbi:MAG: hypothetical protein ACLPWD_06565 [Methanobacterium sp.]
MADFGISEFLIGVFGIESIGTFLFNLFEGVCEFLGEEGSSLMLEIVPNLNFSGIETVYQAAYLDADGIVSGFGPQITTVLGVDKDKLLRFVQIISQNMVKKGIAWASETGQSFFISFMEKLNEYKGTLTLGAANAVATGLLLKYASQGKTPEDKEIEKETQIPLKLNNNINI